LEKEQAKIQAALDKVRAEGDAYSAEVKKGEAEL